MSKLKYFSENKTVEIDFDPYDVFLEVGMNGMSNKELIEFLKSLDKSQIAELKSTIRKELRTKPTSSDEVAMISGLKTVDKILRTHNFSQKIKQIEIKLNNLSRSL